MKFEIGFMKNGVCQSRIIDGPDAETCSAFFRYEEPAAEYFGIHEADFVKPGQPVDTVPAGWTPESVYLSESYNEAPEAIREAVATPFAVLLPDGDILPAEDCAEVEHLRAGYPGAMAFRVTAQEAQEAQEAQRIEIDGSVNFPAPHTFWSNSPRLILNPDAIPEPIDTTRNPHIAMMLRYQAEELMSSVFSDWYDDILSRDEIENDAFFTDNSLNLNNGDGYKIAENLFIDHIFAISLYDSPRGVVAVYDSDCDDFSYWLIY